MSKPKNPTLRRRTKELSECAEDAMECQLLGYELKDLGSLLVKMAIHMNDLQRKVDSQAEYIRTLNADRKTENGSEKPNNCETCKHWWRSEDVCLLDDCQYEPKTEPQTIYYPQVDGITPSVILPKTEPQTEMTLDDAYYLVYKDLTKMDDILTGKYDAKNGNKQYMNGVWTVMELIAYGVGIDCYEAFNERFCRNLEKSQEQTKESETDCAWKKGASDDSKRADK